MSDPIKGNAEIRADQPAFMAAYDRARVAFRQLPGVVDVGFGHKEVGGRFREVVTITVYVRQKLSDAAVPPEQRIPATFEGYPTDVQEVRLVKQRGCDNVTSYDTIRGGIQVEANGSTRSMTSAAVGTLGCIVRRRGDGRRENVYLLSNFHVLFDNSARAGDYLYHPYAERVGSTYSGKGLGPIQDPSFRANRSSVVPDVAPGPSVTDTFYIDCAFARLDIDSKCCGSTCTQDTTHYAPEIIDLQVAGVNTISDVRSVARDPAIVVPDGTTPDATSPRVFKVGRTTGRTAGIVRSVNAPGRSYVDAFHETGPTFDTFNNLHIEFDVASVPSHLNCHGHAAFSEQGDSGSLILDDHGRAIALLYGGTTSAAGVDLTTACHILPVLDALGLCIATTGGTSHGSSGATDGSGVAPAAVADDGGSSGGGIEFADARIAAPRGVPDFPSLAVISDARRVVLLARRDALRTTPIGRELHDAFALVRREIGYLVRNVRPVKVAWHRCQGPAFMAHVLNHLRGDLASVPRTVAGVTREAMLLRMGDVLAAHGSHPLRDVLARHRALLVPLLRDCDTIDEALQQLGVALPEAHEPMTADAERGR